MPIGIDKLCVHRQKGLLLSLGITGVDTCLESQVEDNQENITYKTFQGRKEVKRLAITWLPMKHNIDVHRARNETSGE